MLARNHSINRRIYRALKRKRTYLVFSLLADHIDRYLERAELLATFHPHCWQCADCGREVHCPDGRCPSVEAHAGKVCGCKADTRL